jgi:starch synthase
MVRVLLLALTDYHVYFMNNVFLGRRIPKMKIAILTNEYPPNIYGGAGVHVENLTRELIAADNGTHSVEVLCFGSQCLNAPGIKVIGINSTFDFGFRETRMEKLAGVLLRDIQMAGVLGDADVIHCHTWYTHLAGCLLKQLTGSPLVLTTHSLEPQRPWKEEQLGPGYKVSGWIEMTAFQCADGVIAVSSAMKTDVQNLYGVSPEKVRVIYNGIDPGRYTPDPDKTILTAHGIDSEKPFVLFVGRITRQKGIIHLVNAVRDIRPGVGIVLCAGAPDTPEIGLEMEQRVKEARMKSNRQVVWIPEFLSISEVIKLYSLASVFVCPSIYEPFGLINIEAMACGTPVVGAAIGGIPEIVVEGETGLLVRFEARSETDPEPIDPKAYSKSLAESINRLLDAPDLAREMGKRGRRRVEEVFSWRSVAKQTIDFYKDLIDRQRSLSKS